jgi:hypothetical protein
LQYNYLGVWPGLLEALPWDEIKLLDFFLETLIFSTPLGEKTLREAANVGRIAVGKIKLMRKSSCKNRITKPKMSRASSR